MTQYFVTTHPKNGLEVKLGFDDDLRLVSAEYDDGEAVDLTERIKSDFEHDIALYTDVLCKE